MTEAGRRHKIAPMSRAHSTYFFLLLLLLPLFYGCQGSKRSFGGLPPALPLGCGQIDAGLDFSRRIETLNLISQAYERGCYDRVIRYGGRAQEAYRQKTFSILQETSNLFLPDGTWIDYVLESYERAYLSFLIAASYYQQSQPDETKVALRRLDHELTTPLYNFGDDPVNISLQAVLWEKVGEAGEARVDWSRLQEQKGIEAPIRAFAAKRTEAIDRRDPVRPVWKVYDLGPFPDLEWGVAWLDSKSGYFVIKPENPFMENCASETGFRLSTKPWFEKIAGRHQHGYHPLLNIQSWIRLPVSVIYGLTTFVLGTGMAVGGCALDAGLHGNGDLCNGAVRAGFMVIGESPEVIRRTLKPDLRHWERVPSGLLITAADEIQGEACFKTWPATRQGRVRRVL